MAEFIPLYSHVLIKRSEPKAKLGAFMMPEEQKQKPLQGEVIAVGEGYRDKDGTIIPLKVKVGDVVIVGKYAGAEPNIPEIAKDGMLIVVSEEEILGILRA